LPHEIQRDEIKGYPVETLELLAIEIYENSLTLREEPLGIFKIILRERVIKLNNNFEWTNGNKQKLLNVNDKFMQVFDMAYNEAISSAFELENRIKNNDQFIKDYEIKIKMTPYWNEQFYKGNGSIGYVLSEPKPLYSIIKYSFGHSSYNDEINEKPIYLNKSLNWNTEYFGDTFKDNYICFEIHELLDSQEWSFNDIIIINKIWADVEVIYQHYIENIQ
jgi:hypothetical protein